MGTALAVRNHRSRDRASRRQARGTEILPLEGIARWWWHTRIRSPAQGMCDAMRAAGLVVVGSNKKSPKINEILLAKLQAKVDKLTTKASELPVREQSKRAQLKATRQQYVQKIEEHKRANGRLAQVHPRTPQIYATHFTGAVARSPTSARRHSGWLAALRARKTRPTALLPLPAQKAASLMSEECGRCGKSRVLRQSRVGRG